MTVDYTSHSVEETEALAARLALEAKQKGKVFIALFGDMGVGKTAFTTGFASHFSVSGVKSPTYTVMNEYRGRATIYHFDMYRITDGDDLYSIGYDDYIESDAYSLVEWSENIEDFIPEGAVFVTIERCPEDENKRRITFDL